MVFFNFLKNHFELQLLELSFTILSILHRFKNPSKWSTFNKKIVSVKTFTAISFSVYTVHKLVAFITFINFTYLCTVGCFISRATNFVNGARKGVCGNYFHKSTLVELFTIHMNLHVMEFPLICGEKFCGSPKNL